MPRFIDLSATIANSREGSPEFFGAEFWYTGHDAGAEQIQACIVLPR